jgi:Zn-dependent M16 (insulinase) family peptidase
MGSESFPYKGVLDKLALRSLSQGTNAWTDKDHTCYTLQTAGAEGFLNLLPVYLDHILYPLLTDSAFITEVHHITGEGKNAGVVYSEMQARENTAESLSQRSLLSLLYPGECGYNAETGGLMSDLRTLTVDTIRKYHASFYRPDNLSLIITGEVDTDALFACLGAFEQRVISKGALPAMVRPFSGPVNPFLKNQTLRVTYPSEDEDSGSVSIGWRGPAWDNLADRGNIEILWVYLTQSLVSVLQRAFIEVSDPLCGSIDTGTLDYCETAHYCNFDSVPTARLDEVEGALFRELDRVVVEGIDMTRMGSVIRQVRRGLLSQQENDLSGHVSDFAIEEAIYGSRPAQFAELFDCQSRLDVMQKLSSSDWVKILQKYFLHTPHACVIAVPSISGSIQAQEEERVAQQLASLQVEPNKLTELAETLTNAMAHNSKPVPSEVISSFQIPDFKKIGFLPVYICRSDAPPPSSSSDEALETKATEERDSKRARFTDEQSALSPSLGVAHFNRLHPRYSVLTSALLPSSQAMNQLPFFLQVSHVPSAFVQIEAYLDTDPLPESLRAYLPLFREVLFECEILGDDKKSWQSVHTVVARLEDEMVGYGASQGEGGQSFSPGSFAQLFLVSVHLEANQYPLAVRWIRDLFWRSRYTPEGVRVCIKRLLSGISRMKNDGAFVASAALKKLSFGPQSNYSRSSFLVQQKFLQSLLTRPLEEVCAELEQVRHQLASHYMRFHCVVDAVKQGPDLLGAWSVITEEVKSSGSPPALPLSRSHQIVPPSSHVIACPAAESCFLNANSPLGIHSFESQQLTDLRVLIELLTAVEGVMWTSLRGAGLCYSFGMHASVEQNLLYFFLNEAVGIVPAYKTFMDILRAERKWDVASVEGAKSAVASEMLNSGNTMAQAAGDLFADYLKGVAPGTSRRAMGLVQGVQEHSLTEALLSLRAMVEKATLMVVLNPSMLEGIRNSLPRELIPSPSVDNFFLGADANPDEEEEEVEGDEEVEEDEQT